jgi:hypothetical protein
MLNWRLSVPSLRRCRSDKADRDPKEESLSLSEIQSEHTDGAIPGELKKCGEPARGSFFILKTQLASKKLPLWDEGGVGEGRIWVSLKKARDEHMFSGMPPRAAKRAVPALTFSARSRLIFDHFDPTVLLP